MKETRQHIFFTTMDHTRLVLTHFTLIRNANVGSLIGHIVNIPTFKIYNNRHHAAFTRWAIHRHTHHHHHWQKDWLIWLINWFIDWLIDWLTDSLIDRLIDWVTDWLRDWLTDWLTDWLIDWLIVWPLLLAYSVLRYLFRHDSVILVS